MNKNSDQKNTELETYINIITSIAGSSASQIEGVASVSFEVGLSNNLFDFGKNKKNQAIEVRINNDNMVIIDMSINVYYGYKIPYLICELQEKIKHNVEEQTYFKIKNINVTVVGVVARH